MCPFKMHINISQHSLYILIFFQCMILNNIKIIAIILNNNSILNYELILYLLRNSFIYTLILNIQAKKNIGNIKKLVYKISAL